VYIDAIVADGALARYPDEYEQRVTEFLDSAWR